MNFSMCWPSKKLAVISVSFLLYRALCYTNDLTLVCPSTCIRVTDIMLHIRENLSLKFNSTKVLVTYNVHSNFVHKLNGIPIVKADKTSHLGHIIGNNSDCIHLSPGVCNLITSTTLCYQSLISVQPW